MIGCLFLLIIGVYLFPFPRSPLPQPVSGFNDAVIGYPRSLTRRLFLPITLRMEEEFAGNALQADTTGWMADLCIW